MACITHERPVHINSKGTISCLEIAACKVLSVKVSNLIHKLFPVFLHCQNNRPKQTAASRTTYVIFKHIQETGRVVTAPAVTSLWWILQTYVVAQAFHKDLLGLWRNFASMCISEQLNHLQAHTVPFALLPEHTHTHQTICSPLWEIAAAILHRAIANLLCQQGPYELAQLEVRRHMLHPYRPETTRRCRKSQVRLSKTLRNFNIGPYPGKCAIVDVYK